MLPVGLSVDWDSDSEWDVAVGFVDVGLVVDEECCSVAV